MPSKATLIASLTALTLGTFAAEQSRAGLLISNIELTTTSLSFDLSGTIDDVVGSNNSNILFIGEIGNTDWITTNFASGTWTAVDSNTQGAFAEVLAFGSQVNRASISVQNHPFVAGDEIEGSFSVTDSSFDPTATDTSNWVVSVGHNDVAFLDATTVTGSAAPEPTSFALLLASGLGIACRRRRRAS